MFEVKIYTFASLRDGLAEDPEFILTMNKSYWEDDEKLKSYILHVLIERRSLRHNGTSDYMLPDTGTLMLAVNEVYAEPGKPIQLSPMDTIALIPPVSGG